MFEQVIRLVLQLGRMTQTMIRIWELTAITHFIRSRRVGVDQIHPAYMYTRG